MKYLLGYACQSTKYPQLKSHNTTSFKYLKSLPKANQQAYLKQKSHQNLKNLRLLLEKNLQRGIQAFRISNELIPFGDGAYYNVQKQHKQQLEAIGKYANQHNMYLSFHASQFIVLNSKKVEAVKNSITNLNFFGMVLKLMKLKNTPNIVIHIGAIKDYKNYEEACDAWCQNFKSLTKQTQSYIVVQNDQTKHSIDSCMYIHKKVGVPVVFDHAHYDYKKVEGIDMNQAMKLAMGTWGNRTPKVHLCTQACGVKIHNHGPEMKLADFLKVYESLKLTGVQKCIMMLQVKDKDNALQKLVDEIKDYEKKNKIVL